MSNAPGSDTKAIRVGTLEGKPVYGGELEVKLRVQRRGDDPAGDFLRGGRRHAAAFAHA